MTKSRGIAKPVKIKWRTSYREARDYIEDQGVLNENGCWEWPGAKGSGGYPTTSIKNKGIKLSRFVWETYRGKIPEGKYVCHKCDNPGCVNPDHLFLGTQQENIHDMLSKGRGQDGLRRPKLNPRKVIKMKEMFVEGCSYKSLSRQFGVQVRVVREIIVEQRWKGTGPDVSHLVARRSVAHLKMTNEKAQEVRQLLSLGVKPKELPQMFGVSLTTIYEIRKGRSWKGVK